MHCCVPSETLVHHVVKKYDSTTKYTRNAQRTQVKMWKSYCCDPCETLVPIVVNKHNSTNKYTRNAQRAQIRI